MRAWAVKASRGTPKQRKFSCGRIVDVFGGEKKKGTLASYKVNSVRNHSEH